MSFKVDSFHVKRNQLEVDFQVYGQETTLYELTFEKDRIEAAGIDWAQFVKSVEKVMEEFKIKGDSDQRRLAGGNNE